MVNIPKKGNNQNTKRFEISVYIISNETTAELELLIHFWGMG